MTGSSAGALVVGGDYQGLGIARSLGRQGSRCSPGRRAVDRTDVAVRPAPREGARAARTGGDDRRTRGRRRAVRSCTGGFSSPHARRPWPRSRRSARRWASSCGFRHRAGSRCAGPGTSARPTGSQRAWGYRPRRPGCRETRPSSRSSTWPGRWSSSPRSRRTSSTPPGRRRGAPTPARSCVARYREACRIVAPERDHRPGGVPAAATARSAYCAFFKDGRPVASMTARRRDSIRPTSAGRARSSRRSTSRSSRSRRGRFLDEIELLRPRRARVQARPARRRLQAARRQRQHVGVPPLGPAAGVDFPYLLFRDQVGLPVAEAKARSGVRWSGWPPTCRTPSATWPPSRSVPGTTFARFAASTPRPCSPLRDPLPGLYEVALLPYLAVRRGL